MSRLQRKAGYSAVGYTSAILVFLASQASALAQNVAPPAVPRAEGESALDCARKAERSTTDAAVTLSPSRGWQMVGREIEVTITSSNLPADAKPIVLLQLEAQD